MRVEPVPEIHLDDSAAVREYLSGAGRVCERFSFPPHEPAAYAARARYLAETYSTPRDQLSAALVAYNRAIGADAAALDNARRLAGSGCLAVVTGQQAGVGTGPVYTIYKAITAIHLAARQAAALGVPVVPVFWVAGEDHDFAEIAAVEFPGREGWERLQLGGEPPGRRSVAHLPVGPAVHDLLDRLAGALPRTEFTDGVLSALRADAGVAANLADWFARIMARLFAGTGLVFVNSADPSLRRLECPFLQLALERFQAVGEALDAGRRAWEAAGYTPTVAVAPESVNLFLYVDGERLALAGAGDRIWLRDRPDQAWQRDELLALAAEQPERFSTNVVLRPVCQGFVLPDLAYVGGPGEIQYWGLYREVFAVFGRRLPLVYPRIGATLVEPPLARYLKGQQVTPADVILRAGRLRADTLQRADTLGLPDLFGQFRRDLEARYEELVAKLETLDPGLRAVAAENRRRMGQQIDYLAEKAAQAHRQKCDVALRRIDRLESSFRPRGELQERVANIVYYLCKYGPDLVGRLVQTLHLQEPWVHLAVYL